MRLTAVTRVLNEEDIIEPFIRHHAAFVEAHILLDNGSGDRTLEILAALRREYHAEGTDDTRRRDIIAEGLEVRSELRATVNGKLIALQEFLADLDAERDRLQRLLTDPGVASPT